MIELRLGPKDVLRLRFAISPLWETLAAVRAVTVGPLPPVLQPWRKLVTPPVTPLLTALQDGVSYTPDFLTPPPAAGERTFDAEVELVAGTPLETVRLELRRSKRLGARFPSAATTASRAQAVDEMRLAWRALLQPHWPRLHRVLATDVDHRSRRLVTGGLAALMADLHPAVTFTDGRLRVRSGAKDRRDLEGEGVVLMPSVFISSSRPLVILDPPYQPTLIYPARGIATAFTRPVAPADALVTLLGQGRADVLAGLDDPLGTKALAFNLFRADSTVSEHLHALLNAGLVEVTRVGKRSTWERTALGDALVSGPIRSGAA